MLDLDAHCLLAVVDALRWNWFFDATALADRRDLDGSEKYKLMTIGRPGETNPGPLHQLGILRQGSGPDQAG